MARIPIETVAFDGTTLRLIDQTLLPGTLHVQEITDWRDTVDAIRTMVVRGAPAIGCTAAAGMAMAAATLNGESTPALLSALAEAADLFRAARPTAVNLFWAVDQLMQIAVANGDSVEAIRVATNRLAREIIDQDVAINMALGEHGASLIPFGATILTHCNAGALCAAGFGTALGVVRAAANQGKQVQVVADETRPRLQGMKLTAWELQYDGIPVTVIADGMAAVKLRDGAITCVVVGADRIAANGDAANKIGTYGLAVQAHYHKVPFYVAAPTSTIDMNLAEGSLIPIEERDHMEMTHIDGARVAPEGVAVWNPSFDVTPAELISAIITERGVLHSPTAAGVHAMMCGEQLNTRDGDNGE